MGQKHLKIYLHYCFLAFLLPFTTVAQQNDLDCGLEIANTGNLTKANLSFELFRLNNLETPEGITISYQVIHPTEGVIYGQPLSIADLNFSKLNNTFYTTFQPQGLVADNLLLKVTVLDEVGGMEGICQERLNRPNAKVNFHMRNLSEANRLNYVLTEDSIAFAGGVGEKVYLVHFRDVFLPAPPPMGGGSGAASSELKVDSVIVVPTNTAIKLEKEGLYLAQSDTTTANGLGFRVESDFPKFKKFEDLVNSMIYLSTNTEIEGMLNAAEKRASFDNFWLNSGGSVEVAQNLIREYYRRVAYANEYFTNYKQGWKTDKGQIYIVMGEPDNIEKTADLERWTYLASARRRGATFEFMKRPNIFTGFHFDLLRSSEFRRVWLETVEMWRKGEI